ncbi:hypothetical protein IMCC26207_109339 [Actinobacteria bacterium IMCC26207]|nr:hypothetical protein IMCC26207_109339 [Actinobacteria bacterium IMCC26207]
MSRIGADPVALRHLGVTLTRLADQAELSATSLDRRVRQSSWRGRYADEFLRDWQRTQQPQLRAIAKACSLGSTHLKQQAEQQEVASSQAGKVAQTSDLRKPAPFPTSELRVLSGTQITAGVLVVGITHNLSIQHFEHERVTVTSTERNQAGLAATSGTSVWIGSSGAALGASLRAQVAVAQVTRREFSTTEKDLLPTLALIEAQAAIRRTVAANIRLPGLGLRARTEELTELSLTAQGTASLAASLGAQGVLRGGGSFRFGRSEHAQVLELEGTTASLLSAQLLQRFRLASVGDGGTEIRLSRLRIEIPDQALHSADVIVSTTSTDGHRELRSLSNLDLSEPGTIRCVEHVRAAVDQLRQGDVDAAMHTLSELELPVGESLSRSAEFAVSEHTGIFGASVGAGIGLGVSADGGFQQLKLVN